MRLIDWLFFVTIFFLPTLSNSQIPTNPNYTDAQNLRQGKWTILFDKEWEKVTTTDSTVYYRLLEYKDDLPVNEVHDYFKNGKIKRTATFLSDKPEIELDISKPITHYFEDGSKDMASLMSDKGIYYRDRGKLDKALPFLLKAKEICLKKKGKENDDYLNCINDLAMLYHRQGNYEKAKSLYIEKKDLREKISGKQNADYATSVDNLGLLFEDIGNFKAAEVLLLEALGIREKMFGKENTEYAYSLHNLASHYSNVGKYKYAEIMFLEALPIWERIQGKESTDYLNTLNSLAELYVEKGNYAKAEPMYLHAKEVQGKVLGKTHPDYSVTLNNLALLYDNLGRFSDAETIYLESLLIKEKTSGKETMDYAIGLNNLASVYFELGDFRKSQKRFLSALKIIEKLVGKAHPMYATTIDNLSSIYVQMGDYKKAESLKKEALEIRLKVLGKKHPDYAVSLESMGSFYLEVGNYQKAEDLFVETKTIRSKVLGKLNPDYALTLNNLALVYQNSQQLLKAEAQLLEAQSIYEKTIGIDHPLYAIVLANLASIYSDLGNYIKMESLYLQAKAIVEKKLGKESAAYASSLLDLGRVYEILGKDSLSEPYYLEAKEIIGKVLGKSHPKYSSAVYDLASYYSLKNENEKAEPYYLELVTKILDQMNRYFPLFSDQEKKLYYEENKEPLTAFKLFCVERSKKNPALLSYFYNLTLQTKGILFNSSEKIRQRIMTSKNQVLIDQYKAWKSKREQLSKLYKMSAEEKKRLGFSEKKVMEEANEAEKKLSLSSENYSTRNEAIQYTWEDVRNRLQVGEVAIEVIRMQKWMWEKEGKWRSYRMRSIYVALLITPETKEHPEMILLKNGDDLENKFVRYYSNAVKLQQLDTISFAQYWKPIADKIQGAKKVYFSVDGVYNQVNLNTLYNPSTKKYLIDEIEVQIVTSTKELITNAKATRARIRDATLFGYPNYNNSKASSSDSSRSINFAPVNTVEIKTESTQRMFNGENINELPGTKAEVETIKALLKKNNIVMHEYLFDEATESEIKKLNSPQVLHIATHGFFLSDLPVQKDKGRGFAGMETKKIAENPMLRSGLLFAGVKNAFTTTSAIENNEGEDGILTAYEAMNLDLDQTDLVVMSACETGLGVTANGEGVYGLQRAFQVAGAKSVLMSLWTVSDDATQKLMTLFYENWLGGKTPREAFRMAQLSLREKYPQPYYWGAFVLVGN